MNGIMIQIQTRIKKMLNREKPASLSVNQSVSCPGGESFSQSVSWSAGSQPVSQTVSQSVSQAGNQPVSQSINQSVSERSSQSFRRPVSQSVGQPVNQPTSHWVVMKRSRWGMGLHRNSMKFSKFQKSTGFEPF